MKKMSRTSCIFEFVRQQPNYLKQVQIVIDFIKSGAPERMYLSQIKKRSAVLNTGRHTQITHDEKH